MNPPPMNPSAGWPQPPGPAPPNMYNGAGHPNNLSNQMSQMNLGPGGPPQGMPQQQQQPPMSQYAGGPPAMMPGQPMKQQMHQPGQMAAPMGAMPPPTMPQMPAQRPGPIAGGPPSQMNGNMNSNPQQQLPQPPPPLQPPPQQQQPPLQQQQPPQQQFSNQQPMHPMSSDHPSAMKMPPPPGGPQLQQSHQPQQQQQQFPSPPNSLMGPQSQPPSNIGQPAYQQQQQQPQQQPPMMNNAGPHMPPPISNAQYPPPPISSATIGGQSQPMPSQMRPPMPQQQLQQQQHQPTQQQPGGMPGYPNQSQMPNQMGRPPMPGQMMAPPMPGAQYAGQYNQQQPMYNQQPMGMGGGYPGGQPGPDGLSGGGGGGVAQPAQRLDPAHMPNPVQMMAENQAAWNKPFVTTQTDVVPPPLVSTQFVTHDQGNSGPRFIRSTMYSIPTTADMMKQVAMPFALVLSPFARTVEGEQTPPIVDFGEMGPIRCLRCKAYMSPNMQFIDGGRRFQCLLCKQTTEVPSEYFQHLDHTGQRVDKYQRPELVLGTYEFVATKDYCRNNKPPKPPAIVFVLDVSYNNVKSGLVHLMCREMKDILKHLVMDQGHTRSYMRVGFITYNNTVHFYNCKSTLAQPQMMIVGDLPEMFMPLLDGFLVDPEESATVIDALMEQIPSMFGETRETETILLPAIQAGLEALKASESVGKLLVFQSSLPIAEAPGKLKNREDRKLLGTDKEKTILMPQCTTYNNLGQECVQAGCSVDLFLFNNSYIDIATIGQVARLTGGEIYKYTYFQADIDGHRVISDVIKNVSRPIAFDTVMRVRTSTGIRPTDFYGHFFMSNTTDMEVASIDCDKSIAIEIKHDDKLQEENIYVQVALLYTSCSGQRRLRIINLALKTCTTTADLFRSCDMDATVLFFAKQAIFKLLDNTPKLVRDNMISRCAQILAAYRKHCAQPAAPGQLILPECLKLLPLYTAGMLKDDALFGGSDMTCDDRSFVMHYVMCMDLPSSVSYFYPRLIPIHNVDPEGTGIPRQTRCTVEMLADNGAFILENGVYMFIWLGLSLAPEFTQAVFGVPMAQQVDTERVGLPVFETPLSKRVRDIVDQIQASKHRCMRLTLVRQRDKMENVLKHYLVEDRGTNGASSYVDFLCYLHKEIRTLTR